MTLLMCCHSAFRSCCLHSLWHFLYVDHLLVFLAFLKSLAFRLSARLTFLYFSSVKYLVIILYFAEMP